MSVKMVKNIVCNHCDRVILRPDEKTSDLLILNSARMSIFMDSDAVCIKKDIGPFHFCDKKCLIDFLQSGKTTILKCDVF